LQTQFSRIVGIVLKQVQPFSVDLVNRFIVATSLATNGRQLKTRVFFRGSEANSQTRLQAHTIAQARNQGGAFGAFAPPTEIFKTLHSNFDIFAETFKE